MRRQRRTITAAARLLVAALGLIGLASTPRADEGRFFETGNAIYSGCRKDSPRRAETTRYVSGFVDGDRLAERGDPARKFCIPEEFSASQVTDVICLALQRHTEIRHLPAAHTVLKALREEYPCR